MKITPADIKNQSFNKSLRGYDKAEVDAFLNLVSGDLEDLVKENSSMKDRLLEFEAKMGGHKDVEKVVQELLLSARKSAEEVKKNAEKEAELSETVYGFSLSISATEIWRREVRSRP